MDIVAIRSGAAPAGEAVLTEHNNAERRGFEAATGDVARLVAADGRVRALPISGVGRNLTDGEADPSNDWITFYAIIAVGRHAQRRAGLHDARHPAARQPARGRRADDRRSA